GCVRYLEIVANPTAAPIKAALQIGSFLDAGSFSRVVVAPQATSNTCAVVDGGTNCCSSPALGFVFAGTTAAVSVTNSHFVTGDNFASYRWDVTVPAGGTAILMHFAVQNAATDTQGAQAQSQSLVQLSNADALTGMSDSERSAVVNFTVPPL